MNASYDMALAMGRMTMAWSRVHYSLYELLYYITEHENRAASRVEFFRIQEDRHKRKVVEDAFIASLGPTHPLSLRLLATLTRCCDLADKRNAFIHTPLFEVEGLEGVHPLGGLDPEEKWEGKRASRYHVRPNALADCLELLREIEEMEELIDQLVNEAIIASMVARAASA